MGRGGKGRISCFLCLGWGRKFLGIDRCPPKGLSYVLPIKPPPPPPSPPSSLSSSHRSFSSLFLCSFKSQEQAQLRGKSRANSMHDLVDGVFSPSGFPLEQKTSSSWPQREGMRFFEHTSFTTYPARMSAIKPSVCGAMVMGTIFPITRPNQGDDRNRAQVHPTFLFLFCFIIRGILQLRLGM